MKAEALAIVELAQRSECLPGFAERYVATSCKVWSEETAHPPDFPGEMERELSIADS